MAIPRYYLVLEDYSYRTRIETYPVDRGIYDLAAEDQTAWRWLARRGWGTIQIISRKRLEGALLYGQKAGLVSALGASGVPAAQAALALLE